MRNRQRDEVVRDILHTAMGDGAGISKVMFYACLSHSQATAYLSQLVGDGLLINDVELGKKYYRTTPRGVQYLLGLNSMCEMLHMQTKA